MRYERADFSADPTASWVLVATDDGAATTGAEVLLNGVQRVAKADLQNEVRIPSQAQTRRTTATWVRTHDPVWRLLQRERK